MEGSLTVLLVDDHALFRAGLVVLLKKMPEVGVVLEVGSGAKALEQVSISGELDLVILDHGLPDMTGIEVLRRLKVSSPELPVILLSASIESELIQCALGENASGFIPKTSTPDVMLAAMQLVLNGGIYIPPEAIADRPYHHTQFIPNGIVASAPQTAQLTQRQMDVLLQMKCGLSNKEIARALNMSPSTVKVHVAAILRELGASGRTQAVFLAKDRGLLD